MFTTTAKFKTPIRAEHELLTKNVYPEYYLVEEKGILMFDQKEAIRLQKLRFENEPDLICVILYPVGEWGRIELNRTQP